jgi:hypothetical protein
LFKCDFMIQICSIIIKTNGFFVECGALDGEFMSNTIDLERKFNWAGILIEANPITFQKLISRNRKAHTVPICLSLEPFPTQVYALLYSRNFGFVSLRNASDILAFSYFVFRLFSNRKAVTQPIVTSKVRPKHSRNPEYLALTRVWSLSSVFPFIPFYSPSDKRESIFSVWMSKVMSWKFSKLFRGIKLILRYVTF